MLKNRLLPIFALAAMAAATPALASDDGACTKAPKEQWLSIEKLEAQLTAQGYKVSKIEIEDGCVEAKVSKDGTKSELYLDPATGALTKKEED
jgi:hypothetical protein